MRKRKLDLVTLNPSVGQGEIWRDLDKIAQVTETSEAPNHPVESALISATSSGWRGERRGDDSFDL
jgi:hypothetical protein